MVRKTTSRAAEALPQLVNVADAKRRFSELLGRVAYGGETVMITRRGRPMAELIPPGRGDAGSRLADIEGWLDDDDPFFAAVDAATERRRRPPRALSAARHRRLR